MVRRRAAHPLLGLPVLSIILSMAACTRPEPPAGAGPAVPVEALERFEARGRIAFRRSDGEPKGGQAGLEWRQDGSRSLVSFRGPFGTGGYEVATGPDGVELRTAAGGTVESVPDLAAAEAWLADAVGFEFPLGNARHWLLGTPAPGSPADLERDAMGRLLRLRQSGWVVDYPEYRVADGRWLPRLVTLGNAPEAAPPESGVRVRIVVDRWLLDTAARPIRQ